MSLCYHCIIDMDLSKGSKRNKLSLNQYIRSILEKQVSNLELLAEIRKIGKKIDSLENRMGSLENAYSATSEETQAQQVKIQVVTEKYFAATTAQIPSHSEIIYSSFPLEDQP